MMEEVGDIAACGAGTVSKRVFADGRIERTDTVKDLDLYLSRIGDDRALPDLEAAAKEPDVSYLTFIELRNAIESLGGVCPEREYDDDPEYEALRDL